MGRGGRGRGDGGRIGRRAGENFCWAAMGSLWEEEDAGVGERRKGCTRRDGGTDSGRAPGSSGRGNLCSCAEGAGVSLRTSPACWSPQSSALHANPIANRCTLHNHSRVQDIPTDSLSPPQVSSRSPPGSISSRPVPTRSSLPTTRTGSTSALVRPFAPSTPRSSY